MSPSISYQIAELEGFKKDTNGFLRPQKNSDIAERFGHSKDHNQQAFVKPANKPQTQAFICGGSSYSLEQFASTLGYSLDDFQGEVSLSQKPPSSIPSKKAKTTIKNVFTPNIPKKTL
jgi:hypothetical protein